VFISAHLTSSDLISTDLISSECGVIGRIHGELDRFAAHDPVRRGCDQSQRTQFRRNEVS